MLRFHFWCTTDRRYLWRVLFNHGPEVLKHAAAREGSRVLPRHQRRPCSWVFHGYLCPGPLRVDTSRWTELPLSAEVSTPWLLLSLVWVPWQRWSPCPQSARHLPSHIPSWSPCRTPHGIPPNSPSPWRPPHVYLTLHLCPWYSEHIRWPLLNFTFFH